MRRRLLALFAATVLAVGTVVFIRNDGGSPGADTSRVAEQSAAAAAGSAASAPDGEPGGGGGAASGTVGPSQTAIRLAGQTAWVGLGGEAQFRLRLTRPDGAPPPDVAVSLFPAVATRSDFVQTLTGRVAGTPLVTIGPLPVSALSPEPDGTVVVRVPLQNPDQPPEEPRDPNRITLPRRDGVHPVRVEVREGPSVSATLVTHLVYLPDTHSGAKLGAAMVVPLGTPGAGSQPGQALPVDSIRAAASGLDAVRGIPLALAPSPELLTAVQAAATDSATRSEANELTALLRRAAADRKVLSTSYAPVNLADLLDSGLGDEARVQLDRATAVVGGVLGTPPDGSVWLADGSLDEQSLGFLRRRGVERLVVEEANLVPITDQKLTFTHPFLLDDGEEGRPALVADPGLTAHFAAAKGEDAVLAAHQLLADLAVLYLDRPGDGRRGVVAVAPPDWQPNRAFLDNVSTGLGNHPIVEATSLDSIFQGVPFATTSRGAPLLRRTAEPATNDLASSAAQIRLARRRLTALSTVLGSDATVVSRLEHHLLAAESSRLTGAVERQQELQAVYNGIDNQLSTLEIPSNRSITLTAREGEVPLTFRNKSGSPAKVVLRVESDKLEFPRGTTRLIDLTRPNTTERIAVVARTSGAFPLQVTLESPDGGLVIGESRLTVRSTAVSGVSLAVSIGAAAFLALWWGRHLLKGRRARRLVPT